MTHDSETKRETRLAYAVEGLPGSHELPVNAGQTAGEILGLIQDRHPEAKVKELIIEDEEDVVGDDDCVVERVEAEFKLVHASQGGYIEVVVQYDNEERKRSFRPSATIRSIIQWAVSEEGFGLVEPASKFVMKLEGEALEPEQHLGQISRGDRKVELKLVHGRKILG